MKKIFLVLLLAVLAVSCSKKVEVKGKITGGSPLERMEFISASGVATLPLVNIGANEKGEFNGSFEAPENGMYMMTYGGRQHMVYLKGGQTLNFTADALTFPESIKFQGDVQKNNDYLKKVQESIGKYAQKIDIQKVINNKEDDFLKEAQKIKADLDKIAEDEGKKSEADSDVINYKKDEITASILGLLGQYSMSYGMMTNNPNFKVSENFRKYEKELENDNDRLVKTQPMYRNYLLNKFSKDYQVFTQSKKKDENSTNSGLFAEYLDSRKDVSQITKDYLLSLVMLQFDLSPAMKPEVKEKLAKIIREKIKNGTVKKDMERILFVIGGPEKGKAIEGGKMIKQDGKAFAFSEVKGKPTAVMFYSSWNPYIAESTIPVVKEMVNFYKSKVNFVFVNLDDTKDQFIKTSNAMLIGVSGTNVYAEGGINSKFAEAWGIYGFKTPGFVILDKDGKTEGKYYNINGGEQAAFVQEMDRVSGLKAPSAQPEATLQNDLVAPPAPEAQPTK
ncbi:MAG: TlpA disulfide reductase family protein [Bergeyella sp.]